MRADGLLLMLAKDNSPNIADGKKGSFHGNLILLVQIAL